MAKPLKYLIVEDEARSRETLLKKIEMCNIPDLICSGMAANASEALMLSKLTPPDFLLLDINLPGKNGFELLAELNSMGINPQVIFTSAHTESQILINALKNGPVTYLVKPIDIDELENAIEKTCTIIRNQKMKSNEQPLKIKFNGYMGQVFVSEEKILFIKADSYSSILTLDNGKTIQLSQSLADIEKENLLSDPPFVKIDRSTIVNMNYIEQVLYKHNCLVIRKDDLEIRLNISKKGITDAIQYFNR